MKNKSHKGLLKRIRISKTGLIRHKTSGHKHLRSGKGGKRLRQMRKDPYMASADAVKLERLLYRRLRGRTQARTALRRSPSPAQSKEIKAAKAAKAAAGATATAAPTKPVKTTKTTKTTAASK
jgi:large subunit ribosomal protein L35